MGGINFVGGNNNTHAASFNNNFGARFETGYAMAMAVAESMGYKTKEEFLQGINFVGGSTKFFVSIAHDIKEFKQACEDYEWHKTSIFGSTMKAQDLLATISALMAKINARCNKKFEGSEVYEKYMPAGMK